MKTGLQHTKLDSKYLPTATASIDPKHLLNLEPSGKHVQIVEEEQNETSTAFYKTINDILDEFEKQEFYDEESNTSSVDSDPINDHTPYDNVATSPIRQEQENDRVTTLNPMYKSSSQTSSQDDRFKNAMNFWQDKVKKEEKNKKGPQITKL